MISSVPASSNPDSNAIIPGTEKREWAPCTAGRLTPSRIRPTAVRPMPSHWRREIRRPKLRSAMIASSTTPPASTAWTTDRGATAIAATWKIQAPAAISIPTANSGRGIQTPGGADRAADVDRRSRARAAMLEQKADVRRERADQREQDAE